MRLTPHEESFSSRHTSDESALTALSHEVFPPGLRQQIIEQAADCIKLLDLDGRLLYMNRGGQRAMEIDDFSLCQFSPWLSFWSGEELQRARGALAGALMGKVETFEGEAPTARGTAKWWEVTITPVLDVQGQISHLLAISRDITERKHTQMELAEQARLGMLSLAVSIALTQSVSLKDMLTRCTQALVDHLDAAFARIWILNEAEEMLELHASSGLYTHLDGKHARVPMGAFKIGRIAQHREPHLTNAVIGDTQVHEQEWAKREGMVAFAGYPLLLDDRIMGVMAIFARHALSASTLQAMATIANGIALGIKRHRAEQALRVSEERFRSLANQVPLMIWQSDSHGAGIYVNTTWCRFTGLAEKESLGTGWMSAIHPEDHAVAVTLWKQALASRTPYQTEFRLRRADGVYRDAQVYGTVCSDSAGYVTGYIGTIVDITAQKELEAQREAFVSMVTHELKTPLTALQGNVQLAQRRLTRLLSQEELFPAEQQRTLEEVLTMLSRSQQQLRVLNRLINDLLDASRIQEDKLELRQAPCDLVSLVHETVQNYQTAHPSRLITLDPPQQELLQVCADRDRLRQVLSNYLNNALKFSPETEEIQVGLALEGGDVRVWVADHGPGLSTQAQQHIWERFYQAPQTPAQGTLRLGLGLGLYICQQLINRQQGQVGVQSIPGDGATFWFTLPLISSMPCLPA